MPMEILFGRSILKSLRGVYLSILYIHALPCLKWSAIGLLTEESALVCAEKENCLTVWILYF